jgi:hypothetical protein
MELLHVEGVILKYLRVSETKITNYVRTCDRVLKNVLYKQPRQNETANKFKVKHNF